MRFATAALMGAISIIDMIEGRRGSRAPSSGGVSAPTYTVTRAICDGFEVEEVFRRRLFQLLGDTRLSQVVSGANAGDIRVWSHWFNVYDSDSYSLALNDGYDCTGFDGVTLSN